MGESLKDLGDVMGLVAGVLEFNTTGVEASWCQNVWYPMFLRGAQRGITRGLLDSGALVVARSASKDLEWTNLSILSTAQMSPFTVAATSLYL